ncbi:MAG: PAS domain S-box protein [Verrucomicrobia bacterium]|nr:PAS domain S-box protein [Verrucomicrobiota bacterium]
MTFPAQPAAPSTPRALLIDDHPAIQQALAAVLEAHGYQVESHPSIDEAAHCFSIPHLILMKVEAGDAEGPRFAEWARRKSGRQQPFILGLGPSDVLRIPKAAMLWNDVALWDEGADVIHSKISAATQWLRKNHPAFATMGGRTTAASTGGPGATVQAVNNSFLEQTGLKRATETPRATPATSQPAVIAGNSPFRAVGPPRVVKVEQAAAAPSMPSPVLATAGNQDFYDTYTPANISDDTMEPEQRTKLPPYRPAGIEIRPTQFSVARPASPMPFSLRHGENPGEPGNGNESGRMRQLLDHLPMAVALFDREMRYLATNKRWLEEFSLNEDVLGRSHYEVFPDLHPNWRRVYQRALDGETQRSDDRVINHPDGTRSWVRWEVTPWDENESGSATGIMISCQKMTGEKSNQLVPSPSPIPIPSPDLTPAAQETLKPLPAKPEKPAAEKVEFVDITEKMLQAIDGPGMALDLNGKVAFANRQLSAVLGSDSLVGKRLWDIAGGNQKQTLRDACDNIASNFEKNRKLTIGAQLDFVLFDEEGDAFRLAWSAAPRRDAEDTIVGIALFGSLRKEARPPDTAPLEEQILELEDALALVNSEKKAALQQLEELKSQAAAQKLDVTTLVSGLERKLEQIKASAAAENKAASAGKQEEALPSSIVGALPGGIAVLDRDAKTIFANDGFTALLGFDLKDSGSIEKWLERGSPDDAHAREVTATWWERVWQAHATKVFSLADAGHVLRDIELRPTALAGDRLLIIGTDVTDRRRAEDALRTSEARFRTLFRECGVGVTVVDRTGAILNVNPYLERMLGKNLVELRREKFESLVAPDHLAAKRDLEARLQGGDPNEAGEVDLNLMRTEGEQIPVTLRAARVRNEAGKELFTAFFIRERPAAPAPVASLSPLVTSTVAEAPQKIETPIETAAARLDEPPFRNQLTAALLEAAPCPILIANGDGDLIECNVAAEEFLESEIDALNGQSMAILFAEMDVDAFRNSLIPTLRQTGSFHGEVTIVRPSGTEECSLRLFGVNNPDGELASIIAAIEPHHHAANLELPILTLADVEDSLAKEVATDIGAPKEGIRECLHQIKNHLQILMSLQNLQMKKPGDPVADSALLSTRNRLNAVAHVYQSVGSSGSDPSKIPFHQAGEALLQSLQRGWRSVAPLVELKWRLDELNLSTAHAVPLALVINELVGNAFEHGFSDGREGCIQVRLGVESQRRLAVLIVTNTGIPMSDSRENPNGQGLAIAETLTEQMGGSFRVGTEGKPEFRIVLPLPESDLPS